ncbi:MAG: hypothetical protein IJK87_08210 [Prevotella sp.]|nr:hypothetical protein [Prevotella sp.]
MKTKEQNSERHSLSQRTIPPIMFARVTSARARIEKTKEKPQTKIVSREVFDGCVH